MDTKNVSAPVKPVVENKFSLGQLPNGQYLIGKVVGDTSVRDFERDGKPGGTYTTTLHAEGTLYDFVVYGSPSGTAKPVTDRGEPIVMLKEGQRALLRQESYFRNKATGRREISKINGVVLDAQDPK